MTQDQFLILKPGDIVRGKLSGCSFVVTANYGGHVTAVRTTEITNPREWDLIDLSQPDRQ